MKKLPLAFLLLLIGCSSSGCTKQEQSSTEDNFIGIWEEVDLETKSTYQKAIVTEDIISLYWVMDATEALYWSGSYDGGNTTFTSINDLQQRESDFLASDEKEKIFTYADGYLTYSVSMMDIIMEIQLVQVSDELPTIEPSTAYTTIDKGDALFSLPSDWIASTSMGMDYFYVSENPKDGFLIYTNNALDDTLSEEDLQSFYEEVANSFAASAQEDTLHHQYLEDSNCLRVDFVQMIEDSPFEVQFYSFVRNNNGFGFSFVFPEGSMAQYQETIDTIVSGIQFDR